MSKAFDNRTYIIGIAKHDRKVIHQLMKSMQPVILNVLLKKGASKDQATDIFMDALEAIYREILKHGVEPTIKKLDDPPKTKLQTYLTRISLNMWFNVTRRNKIKTGVTEAEELLFSSDETITTEIHAVERRKLFMEKMNALSASCRQILQLFFEKTSMKEIASIMNVTEQYAKKKKFTCKKKLVEQIQLDAPFDELSL